MKIVIVGHPAGGETANMGQPNMEDDCLPEMEVQSIEYYYRDLESEMSINYQKKQQVMIKIAEEFNHEKTDCA